jgi:hypothetical protein
MNKLRLVLRFFFAAGLITIGVDVSTKEFRVTRNRYVLSLFGYRGKPLY